MCSSMQKLSNLSTEECDEQSWDDFTRQENLQFEEIFDGD